jgi:hypothetical protein
VQTTSGMEVTVPRARVRSVSVNVKRGEFAPGDLVLIDARTGPGMNKQGGVGRITKANSGTGSI